MKTAFVLPVLSLALSTTVFADVTLPSVLSPGMVLQRDKPVPVWGQAAAGEKIKVTFAGQTRETSASAEGKWLVRLDPLAANATGQTLTVQGNNKIELADVLIGEVWLGSGQSNMEWPVPGTLARTAWESSCWLGTMAKPSTGVQGSIRVPPQELLIKPTGTPNSRCSSVPMK